MYKYFKRLIDIIASLLALLLLSPLLIIVIIGLYFANRGSGVFFTPLRPGKGGRLFKLYKFKSMRDAFNAKGEKLPDAERLTKIGRFIRLASIDELPQLFNVLKGDMSFIGPRPLSSTYLPYYSNEEKRRHSVLPGITGWAQINGRKSISWGQKLAYDLYYVDNLSFLLDLKVIFITIQNIIRHKDVGVDTSGTQPFSEYREAQWAAEGRQDLIDEAHKNAEPYWAQINKQK